MTSSPFLLSALAAGMLTIAMTKFSHGAWIVVLLIPTLVVVFIVVHRHYEEVARQLSLDDYSPPLPMTVPSRLTERPSAGKVPAPQCSPSGVYSSRRLRGTDAPDLGTSA